MDKLRVNLLITKDIESPSLVKLKKYMPFATFGLFLVVMLSSVGVVLFLDANSKTYESLKTEVSQLSNEAESRKSAEGIYVLTARKISILSNLLSNVYDYSAVIDEIDSLSKDDILLSNVEVDRNGNVSFLFEALSVSDLDDFIERIIELEIERGIFSQIRAEGIIRDKDGKYSTTLKMKTTDKLLDSQNSVLL